MMDTQVRVDTDDEALAALRWCREHWAAVVFFPEYCDECNSAHPKCSVTCLTPAGTPEGAAGYSLAEAVNAIRQNVERDQC